MNISYHVDLTGEERDELNRLLSAGKCSARKLKRGQILLAADGGASDEAIERTIGASGSTIYRTKRRFVEVSLEAALSAGPRR
jgi:transposase